MDNIDYKKYINDFLFDLGVNTKKDTDGDNIFDIFDAKPKDFNNFTEVETKEVFGSEYNLSDKIKDFFGLSPADSDKDGVPDSYELKYGMNVNNPDTDTDGIYDGEEVYKGLNPVNADQDKDGVLDGRDAYPTDSSRSVLENDKDSDIDGIGDRFEAYIGANPYSKDTDGDGLSDAVDDNVKVNYKESTKLKSETLTNINNNSLKFSIQNNFLDFFASIVLMLSIIMFLLFTYVFMRWWSQINHDVEHYYHLFHNAFGFNHHDTEHTHNKTVHKENFKNIKEDIQIKNNLLNEKDNHINHINHDIKYENNNPITTTGNFEPTVKELVFEGELRWGIVSKYMNDDVSDLWRIGVIEADNMLNEALKNIGYIGAGVGERLQSANFKTIDFAWEAHKIRNRIAHEGLSFELTSREARKAFVLYETVFKDLKVI